MDVNELLAKILDRALEEDPEPMTLDFQDSDPGAVEEFTEALSEALAQIGSDAVFYVRVSE